MKGKVTKMTKTITWNDNEIKAIKKMHRYANVSDQIDIFAARLANANNIDNWRAKIISVMLMSCSYTAIRMTDTRIEFIIGSGNADILDENCTVTAYVCGTKAFRMRIENYLNDLYNYLR